MRMSRGLGIGLAIVVAGLGLTQLGCGARAEPGVPSAELVPGVGRVSSPSYRVDIELGAWRSQRSTEGQTLQASPGGVIHRAPRQASASGSTSP